MNYLIKKFPNYTSEYLSNLKSEINRVKIMFGMRIPVNKVTRSYKINLYKNIHTKKLN